MLCGHPGNPAGPLSKHQDVLWTCLEGIFREYQVQAAGEEAAAQGLSRQWRCWWSWSVEQRVLAWEEPHHGSPWLPKLVQFVRHDVSWQNWHWKVDIINGTIAPLHVSSQKKLLWSIAAKVKHYYIRTWMAELKLIELNIWRQAVANVWVFDGKYSPISKYPNHTCLTHI